MFKSLFYLQLRQVLFENWYLEFTDYEFYRIKNAVLLKNTRNNMELFTETPPFAEGADV